MIWGFFPSVGVWWGVPHLLGVLGASTHGMSICSFWYTAATSIFDASSGLCQLCYGSPRVGFLFRVEPPTVLYIICLVSILVSAFYYFHFLMWSLLLMPHPCNGPFYFQASGLPLSVSGAWSDSLCRAHIALQELQTVAIMLHRLAFHLSSKVVALHLDNSTAKAYLCNQGGTVSPFLSRLACWILSLTDKHGITLLPAYIPTHLNVEADYLSQDQLLQEWHLLPQVAFCL